MVVAVPAELGVAFSLEQLVTLLLMRTPFHAWCRCVGKVNGIHQLALQPVLSQQI